MSANKCQSAVWQQLMELTSRAAEWNPGINFIGSSSLDELMFVKYQYKLKLRREKDGERISASILNESVAKGKLPSTLFFACEGTPEEPLLVQAGREIQPEVFLNEVLAWFAGHAKP